MLKRKDAGGAAPGSPEGARSASGSKPGAAAEVKRWSAGRKKEVVLRLLRGERVDAVSREVSVPIYKLERWRHRALAGIDADLNERENDPAERQLDEAKRRFGELAMEVEILQKADGRFYPDFLCPLRGSADQPRPILAVEYTGADRWAGAEDDRLIGELWANLSEGRCRFVMVKDKRWESIEETLPHPPVPQD